MATQINAANWAQVPQVTAKSPEDTQPSNTVHDFGFDAPAKLNHPPTPGSGLGFGTLSSTPRDVGKTAWDGGSGSVKNVVDHIDAPFKLNKDPHIQSNP